MQTTRSVVVVLVTAPDRKTARALARTALQARLAACVNLVHRVESHYWWRGKIDSGTEVLLLIKTARSKLAALEQCLIKCHPYETPEFLVLPVPSGSRRYLRWLNESLRAAARATPRHVSK